MAHFSICFKAFDSAHISRSIRQLQTAISLLYPASLDSGRPTPSESSSQPSAVSLHPLLREHPQGIVPLPKTRKRFTVLSGPHIDKKSREQFEIVRSKTRINFELDAGRAEVFFEMLKHMYFGGVQLSVRVRTNTYLP